MGFCDIPGMGVLCGPITDGLTSSVTGSIGNWIASSIGDLATSGVDLATKGINATTAIDLNSDWFRHNYELLLPIGLTVTVLTFILQLIRAAWRRDGNALAQAVTGTFSGVLFAFAAIALTSVAITVTDALSDGLFQAAGTSVDDSIRRLVKVSEISSTSGLGWVVAAVVAAGCAIGTFLYWGMMMLRKVTVLVLVALAVFAGAGGGWEAAQRWRRGWIEATATVVFSKLLITIVFLIGVSAIGQSKTTDGVGALSDMLAGLTVMALVLMCPFAIYRFVHWAGDPQHADLHQSTAMGLSNAAGKAQKAYGTARTAATGATGAGAAAAGAAAGSGSAAGDTAGNLQGPEGENAEQEPSSAKAASFRFNSRTGAGGDGGRSLYAGRPGDGGTPLFTRPGHTPAPAAADGAEPGSSPANASVALGTGEADAAPPGRLVVFPGPAPQGSTGSATASTAPPGVAPVPAGPTAPAGPPPASVLPPPEPPTGR
ncbi:SCO6881 family protein [Streptacidiphilus fuscans]|uniref:ATP-binding protein n=1 Tax=Streptacidiphilus fuscans TaxID=2789292 RepID=A0A931B938_9ACTN|nr:ATP-binding protein [Streptacidiphilus fuscans]MBF9071767.1 ATP-binding protein [Streptacidiphilus fuscans]